MIVIDSQQAKQAYFNVLILVTLGQKHPLSLLYLNITVYISYYLILSSSWMTKINDAKT